LTVTRDTKTSVGIEMVTFFYHTTWRGRKWQTIRSTTYGKGRLPFRLGRTLPDPELFNRRGLEGKRLSKKKEKAAAYRKA